MMKKLLGILLVLGVGIVLVACNVARATPIPEPICEPEYSTEFVELTIEELGGIIESTVAFWMELISASMIGGSNREVGLTAEHNLIEQDGQHATVETRVEIKCSEIGGALLGYETFHFTFAGTQLAHGILVDSQRVAPEIEVYIPAVADYSEAEEIEDYIDVLLALGDTIAAAGAFWEEWWHLTGRFSSENIDFEVEVPAHLEGFNRLLPSAGFANLAHLRTYLTNYFTDGWISVALFNEGAVFAQYHDYIYVNTTRADVVRPDWTTAEHELIAKDGIFATVATRVSAGTWQPELTNPADVTFTFGLINGRIDTNTPRLIWFEMP